MVSRTGPRKALCQPSSSSSSSFSHSGGTPLLARAVAGVVAGLGLMTMAGGCALSEPPPFDPKRITQIQAEQVQEGTAKPLSRIPATLEATITTDSQGRSRPAPRPHIVSTTQPFGLVEKRLTLQDVIHRTVANNIESRVAGYQPAIDEARILEAEARFDPTIFSQGQVQRQFTQTSIGGSTDPATQYNQSLEFGLRQLMTTGGQIELKQQIQRQEISEIPVTNPFGAPLPPWQAFYTNDLVLQITQPLLRDFGAETNLARITIARNDQKISQLEFRDKVEEVLQRAEETYWRLHEAEQRVIILQDLLRQTEETLDRLVLRGGHDAARLELSQARAGLEARNSELIEARSRVRDLSDQLKATMNDPDYPVAGPVVILPADPPVEQPITFALSDQVENALQNRLELAQQAIRVDSANVVVKAAEDNRLPRLDVSAQVGVQGLGRDFDDAIDSQTDFDFITYAFGFQFEVPIGNRQARAIYQRTLLQRQQAIETYRQLVDQVTADVKIRQNEVETQWERLVAARRAVFANLDVLSAVRLKEQFGEPQTPTWIQLKLDRQAQLATARLAEAEALTSYNVALANVERAKGTLLRYNNVVLQEEKGPMFAKVQRLAVKKE